MKLGAAFIIAPATLLVASVSSAAVICVTPPSVPSCPNHVIQAAVDAAAAGDTVRVAPGLYFESVTIAAGKDNLRLLGSGKMATIIDHDVPNAGNPGISVASSGVTIANLGIRNGTYIGILGYADRTKVSGVRVVGGKGNFTGGMIAGGIYIAGNGTQITASEVRARPAFGIVLYGDDVRVRNNVVAQIERYGIYLEGSRGQILSNQIASAGWAPATAGLYALGTGNTISANILENVGYSSDASGIFSTDGQPTVQSNVLRWSGRVGVICPDCAGGKVALNSVTGSAGYGLSAQSTPAAGAASTLLVQGNRLAWTAWTALSVYGPVGLGPGAGIRVTQNSAADTMALVPYPDCFYAYGSGHTFTLNTARSCGAAGFLSQADDVLFARNIAAGVGTNGFVIDGYSGGGAAHSGATLNSNRAIATLGDGFALYDSSGGTDAPVGTTGAGNLGALNREDFCNEGGATTLGTFATTSTICDVRH